MRKSGRPAMVRRLACLFMATLLLSGCVAHVAPPGSMAIPPTETSGTFLMPDGTVLPYRAWSPTGTPKGVILALHGMNDSRDAWEYPAPLFMAAGLTLISPDLRGFGATSTRGLWPGTDGLAKDTRTMAQLLRARYPKAKLILMAESMGAAALMVLATEPDPPPVDGYVLIAPAVWGRSKMSFLMRASLWLANNLAPGMTVTGRGFVKVTATDNRDALRRLSTDPLTIHETRIDAIKGLVDLMDHAMAAAPHFHAPALFLYGGRDELVPPRATAATWHALPAGETLAFYPNGYHLLLRDRQRMLPIDDILSWVRDPLAPLPSGADKQAAQWLAAQKLEGVGPIHNPAAAP